MYHLHREIDQNLQFVVYIYIYCLYTTQITEVLLERYDLYQSITSSENPNDGIFRSNIF